MKFCIKCVMPDTRPGITFDHEGICSACNAYSARANVDYALRYKELETLCNRYRGMNGKGKYDCMIAVSGGKDSHFQTHIMKEVMGMNPLLVTVGDNFPSTAAGCHNLKNISEEFGCDVIALRPNIKAQKLVSRRTFEMFGKPTYFIDRLIYAYPLQMAQRFNTPLLVYGENISHEYGGANSIETFSAKDQIDNGVASGISLFEILASGVSSNDLNLFEPPIANELCKINPIYLSYFVPWNSYSNYVFAKSRGFHDLSHEWERSHHVEQFDQVDSPAYLIHSWMKYPKFGHASATDYASRFVRYGLLTRAEACELVKQHDHKLDVRSVHEFCEFFGYRDSEFWKIVDKFYHLDLFEKNRFGEWVLKNPVWGK